jgi:signal transduction histidine kinase
MADNSLVLTIENDAPRELPALFTPLSIFERAEALGARTEVASGKGKTRVRVEVPL